MNSVHRISKTITLLILSTVCLTVYAESQQIPIDRKITQINTYSNSDLVFIYISPGFTSTITGCTGNYTRLILEPTTSAAKNALSSAFAAATADKKAGFGVNACWTNVSDGSTYPKIYRIDVAY